MQGKKTRPKVKDLGTKKNPKGGAVPTSGSLKDNRLQPTDQT